MIQNIGHMGAFAPAAYREKTETAETFSGILDRMVPAPKSAPTSNTGDNTNKGVVRLGKISEENPTVSHLLIGHPNYRDDCWKIVHSGINSGKPFRDLPVGRTVSLDPKTGEIFCGEPEERPVRANLENREIKYGRESHIRTDTPSLFQVRDESRSDNPLFSESLSPSGSLDLAGALRPYIGTPYSKIDCFELVVEGLKDLGIEYGGRGGLQNTLIRRALDRGLPMNAYLTGEGLIDVSAMKVYESSHAKTGNSKTRARQVLDEMKSVLEPGLILSFSTETRGHTGIVAKHGGQWTFLNSGRLDNEISPSSSKKGVGEEELEAEIANWLRLAGRRGESLKITAGKLDSRKLVSYINSGPSADHKTNGIKTNV